MNFALFCKMQDARNTISRLLHCITHGGSSGAVSGGNIRDSYAYSAKPKAVNT